MAQLASFRHTTARQASLSALPHPRQKGGLQVQRKPIILAGRASPSRWFRPSNPLLSQLVGSLQQPETAQLSQDRVIASSSRDEPGTSGTFDNEVPSQKNEADLLSLGLEAVESEAEGHHSDSTPWIATLSIVGGVVLLVVGGNLFKDQIKTFLDFFITAVDEWGVWGYVAYAAVYTALEIVAVPAIPLTMTAGVVFGPVLGTLVVSLSATVAATVAFLIARYAVRDKVQAFASKHPKFAAIDKAIGRDGLKFVTLLRLSPLLPLAVSNYIYGLTSVDLGSYVLGSMIGMLPGTYAYVSAGHVGRAVLAEGEGFAGFESWQVFVGLAVTLLAIGFVGSMAKKAIEEVEAENHSGDGV